MKEKTVLVLDDDEETRETLGDFLAEQGFLVRRAGDIPTARRLVGEAGREPDVVVLDVVIEGSRTTGLDFGIEVKQRLREQPPEFLIHTAYPKTEFYRLALELGAATFLVKPGGLSEVLDIVRALTLRRSLFPSRQMVGTIQQLATQSHNVAEAISVFCRNTLRAELEATLGTRFVLLVGEGDATVNHGSAAELPERSMVYGWLQKLAQLQAPSEPLLVADGMEPDGAPSEEREAALELLHQLRGTALIPLASRAGLKVSLGITAREKAGVSALGTPIQFAKILGALVQPTLVRFLMDLTESCVKAHAEQSLDAAADFCLYIGQEQLRLLDGVVQSGVFAGGSLPLELHKLMALGENLRNAGEVLSWIKESLNRPDQVPAEAQQPTHSVAALVCEAWNEISEELALPERDFLEIQGDCRVAASIESLQIAIARILRWLCTRISEAPSHTRPALSVRLRSTAQGQEIVFAHHGKGIPAPLRDGLFSPFATPARGLQLDCYPRLFDLYLARLLIERESGYLEDRAADLEHGSGNCLVMHFPLRPASAASNA